VKDSDLGGEPLHIAICRQEPSETIEADRQGRMGQSNGLFGNFWLTTVASSVISFILGGVLTYFRKKWLLLVQIMRSYIFNAPARVKIAIHIRKYRDQPEAFLSQTIFNAFYEVMGESGISKRALGESSMRIFSERLGLPVNVLLVEEANPEGQDENPPQPFKVSVELDGELRIGYRNVSDFQEFMTLAAKMQDTVRDKCFSAKKPTEEFLICEINRKTRFQTRVLKDKIDNELRVKVSIHDSNVNLVCEEPSYAVNAIRKYFPL
jgi:hypothetical protein